MYTQVDLRASFTHQSVIIQMKKNKFEPSLSVYVTVLPSLLHILKVEIPSAHINRHTHTFRPEAGREDAFLFIAWLRRLVYRGWSKQTVCQWTERLCKQSCSCFLTVPVWLLKPKVCKYENISVTAGRLLPAAHTVKSAPTSQTVLHRLSNSLQLA